MAGIWLTGESVILFLALRGKKKIQLQQQDIVMIYFVAFY